MGKRRSVLQTVTVKTEEFENYLIPFSLKNGIGKKKNKFLFSELEKRHPCFSNDYCFDSFLKLIEKKMFWNVIVMNKSVLMKYQREKKKIVLEGYKRFFFREISRLAVYCFLGAVLLVSVIFSVVCISKGRKTQETVIPVESLDSFEDEIEMQENIQADVTENFLALVESLGGKLSYLEWKNDGRNIQFSSEVYGLYPEELEKDFADGEVSSVVYENEKPCFKFSYHQCFFKKQNHEEKENSFSMKDFRSLIIRENGIIEEETLHPCSVKFQIPLNKLFFEEMEMLLRTSDTGISRFKVSSVKSENERCCFEISLNKQLMFEDGFNLMQSGNYLNVLVKEKPQIQKIRKETKKEEQKKETAENLEKIGEIIFEGGKTKTFYKNAEGKIVTINGERR